MVLEILDQVRLPLLLSLKFKILCACSAYTCLDVVISPLSPPSLSVVLALWNRLLNLGESLLVNSSFDMFLSESTPSQFILLCNIFNL